VLPRELFISVASRKEQSQVHSNVIILFVPHTSDKNLFFAAAVLAVDVRFHERIRLLFNVTLTPEAHNIRLFNVIPQKSVIVDRLIVSVDDVTVTVPDVYLNNPLL